MQGILPDMEVLQYKMHLEERKKKDWYGKVMKNVDKQDLHSEKVSSYGEEDGINALLSFSTLCLIAAEETEDDVKDDFVKLAMSVLLPLTQFSIDRQVWHSTIGTAVISCRNESKVGYYLDEHSQWQGPTKAEEGRMQRKPQRLSKPSKVIRPLSVRKHSHPTNVMPIPTSALMEEWTADDEYVEYLAASNNSQLAMEKVEEAMKNLRKSCTLNALERASIDVAVALTTVASYDECNNPFVCLSQAAMFAAMGSKRGNNDEPFKRFLPLKMKCTPLEALNVLGRADCLRAIHFLHEAQYLCNWVASVCRIHRARRQENDQPQAWNSRWMVIGIVVYMVSTSINETGEAISQDDADAGGLRKWGEDAKQETKHGKADALSLVKQSTAYLPGPGKETNSHAPFDEENLSAEDAYSDNEGSLSLPSPREQRQSEVMRQSDGIHHKSLAGLNPEQQLLPYPLAAPEMVGVQNVEQADEYDPFSGVEEVGI